MVSKFVSGKSIKGALNYNERKVSGNKAALLSAENYLFDKEDLSFYDKLSMLQNLADRNERSKTNCVHISLNFDPSETVSDKKLVSIAKMYMDKIGFGEQPYLIYRHDDSGHPHIHIVTTNIRMDGTRIVSQNIGKNQSEKARKEIEKRFGLIPAESKKSRQELPAEAIKPVPQKVVYGKSETKSAVSNVVRSVVKDYKYTSLAELNAVLRQYNVTAYRGEEGSKMFEKKGLTYSVTDNEGNKIGVPIKASSIYTKPTLTNLEKRFIDNKEQRKRFAGTLKNMIDKVFQSQFIPDKEALKMELEKQNVSVVFRENDTMVYGITFIDNRYKTVFNGSDLGKEYSAKRMMERIGMKGLLEKKERQKNKDFVEKIFRETDYSKGIPHSLASLYANGLRIIPSSDDEGNTVFSLGNSSIREDNFLAADRKITAWLWNNNITLSVLEKLNDEIDNAKEIQYSSSVSSLVNHLAFYIKDVLTAEPIDLLPTIGPDPKKKRRHKTHR